MKHYPAVNHFHDSSRHHWFTEHARSVSFVIACLVGGLLLWAILAIRLYIEPTI